MKNVIIFCAAILAVASVDAARPSHCPAAATTVAQCTANALIPMYPFVAVCKDGSSDFLVIDPGNNRMPETVATTKSVTEESEVWSAVEVEASGELSFTVFSNPDPKFNGLLSFKSFLANHKTKYRCK